MKTPIEYTETIKKGYITEKILAEVLYSINKRAKNWRDKKRELKEYEDAGRWGDFKRQSWFDNAKEKEEEYYEMKFDILELIDAKCIHKDVKYNYITERIYSDYGYGECEFNGKDYSYICDNPSEFNIKKWGSFVDYDNSYEDVYFVDIIVGREVYKTLYFIYYELDEYSFHTPIEFNEIKDKYDNLDIVEIKDFKTYGADISDLLSTQFCNKVYNLFTSEELELRKN